MDDSDEIDDEDMQNFEDNEQSFEKMKKNFLHKMRNNSDLGYLLANNLDP